MVPIVPKEDGTNGSILFDPRTKPNTSISTTATMEARTAWSKRMVVMPSVRSKDVRTRRRVKVVGKAAGGDGKGTGKQEQRTRGWSRLWAGFARPLQDFGIGVKSTKEGGTGLFVVAGVGEIRTMWMRSQHVRRNRSCDPSDRRAPPEPRRRGPC